MTETRRRRTKAVEKDEAKKPRTRRSKAPETASEEKPKERANAYFVSTEKGVEGFSTGCCLFDQALGGIGWATRRIINIVGDKSTGKTLLAIEGMINFHRTFIDQNPRIIYKECESAFDEPYAAALGLPLDDIEVDDDLDTVEDMYEDIERIVMEAERDPRPILYIVDSLDGLSDRAEQGRKIDEASYGQDKAKKLSEFFRKKKKVMSKANITLLIVSQIRDNINAAAFGKKSKRSGGKALDFYCSQVVWLANLGKVTKAVKGKKRIVGVDIRAAIEKNKVGNPFRTADYPIIFGYGCDDIYASVEWLQSNVGWDVLEDLGFKKTTYKAMCAKIRDKGGVEAKELREKLNALVIHHWQEIELDLMPQSSKY
ncbi:DNA recombination/repair protein RecA [Vibrio phage vB_VpaS_MAR10]|uniref:Putative RecA protein n=1 Tax=Vibrio phage vB_VpaS_MAR10 TaxID=1229755 RepID=K7R2J6_9CAUD|nr:DNA recombination/repair protein RecA [Vibrio phage vB_VpaS_MAR10]AFV81309.1 putative RecA protein [Vibrio phage vB_VpaS_MAR10]